MAVVNSVSVNFVMRVPLQTLFVCFFLDIRLGVGLLNHVVVFKETSHCSP